MTIIDEKKAANNKGRNEERGDKSDSESERAKLFCCAFKLGLSLRLKSFTSFSYKISLVKRLIDSSFKICNN